MTRRSDPRKGNPLPAGRARLEPGYPNVLRGLGRRLDAPVLLAVVFLLPACYDPGLETDCQEPECKVISTPLEFDNSYDCHCTCGIDANGNNQLDPEEEDTVQEHNLQVCMTAEHNPNVGGTFTLADLTNDCQDRVGRNLQRIGRSCIADNYICRGCEALPPLTAVASCHEDHDPSTPEPDFCTAEPLQVDQFTKECINFDPQNSQSNFKTATHHPAIGDEPVCLADRSDPPIPTASPLAAGIFGRTTRCEVAGTAQLVGGARNADGVVHVTGEPCPGGTCNVGMFFKLGVHDFERTGDFIPLVDFGKAKFTEMRGWGSSVPEGASLNEFGIGRFEAGELLSTGRGVTETFVCIPGTDQCTHLETFRDTVLARNDGPLDVTVDWAGVPPRCSLNGTVSTLGDGFSVDLVGDIVNRPPRADAGADQVGDQGVECGSPSGATVMLNGGASSDPDDNIRLFSWRRGGRAGEQVALSSEVSVDLGVGETQKYVLTVVDALGQASYDSVLVGVADTTAPSVACNVPETISPRDGLDEDEPAKQPVTFTATATDTCDPAASAAIVGFDCFRDQGGKRIDKTGSCSVAIAGSTITILNSGGVGTRIEWTVQGTDASGNVQHQVCGVLTVK